MHYKHIFLALLIVFIWGCNFVFIRFGVSEISPLFLCAIRFFLASIPAIFFIKPPAAPARFIIIYGLLMFGLQFSFLFLGMKAGITPGLASLLFQVQVFFSIFFAAFFLEERPSLIQMIGAFISFAGIGLVAKHLDGCATLSGFLLVMVASVWCGLGNIIIRKIGCVNTLSLVVWGSFIASFPLLLCSFIFEGPKQILTSIHQLTWLGGGSLLYIVYAATWIGYGGWNKLISHYPIPVVIPFTLLVPVVGLLSSAFMLNEPLPFWKIEAASLVIAGLGINIISTRLALKRTVA